MQYVPETRLSEFEIRAGLDCGVIEPWRIDGNNIQWYKEMPPIHGIPAEDELPIEGDDV